MQVGKSTNDMNENESPDDLICKYSNLSSTLAPGMTQKSFLALVVSYGGLYLLGLTNYTTGQCVNKW